MKSLIPISWICTICAYSDFFLICKLNNSDQQIMPLISDHLNFLTSVYTGDF